MKSLQILLPLPLSPPTSFGIWVLGSTNNPEFLIFLVGLGFKLRALSLHSRGSNAVSHTSSSFCSGYFGDGALWTICPDWLPTIVLPSSWDYRHHPAILNLETLCSCPMCMTAEESWSTDLSLQDDLINEPRNYQRLVFWRVFPCLGLNPGSCAC
jgi:hypothetical protein